jgi:hypothetical protein
MTMPVHLHVHTRAEPHKLPPLGVKSTQPFLRGVRAFGIRGEYLSPICPPIVNEPWPNELRYFTMIPLNPLEDHVVPQLEPCWKTQFFEQYLQITQKFVHLPFTSKTVVIQASMLA